MELRKERAAFEAYLETKRLKHSGPRQAVMEEFFRAESHLTADELYAAVKKKLPGVGFATVYRTLKLLCDSGLSRELRFEDGAARYERLDEGAHHDHLICTRCGTLREVYDPEIERLQAKLFARHGFYPQRHRLELYGLCRSCRPAGKRLQRPEPDAV